MKLLVTTSESINDDRLFRMEYMYSTFLEISKIKTDYTKIVVYVNDVDNTTLENFAIYFANIPINIEYRRITRELKHPYEMCWEHKDLIDEFLGSDFTHFMYYENDIRFTQENMDYWLETRDLFVRNNLNFIPAFHRFELSNSNQVMSLDVVYPTIFNSVSIDGLQFISLGSPYHAMYVMDHDMAREHKTSQFYRYYGEPNFYGISERAALGNMYDNVPEGFQHRALIPVDQFSRCWVHHLPNKFARDPYNSFGKLPIEQVIPAK